MSRRNRIERAALARTLTIVRPHLGGQRTLMAGGINALLC